MAAASDRLTAARVPSPRHDAEQLLAGVLGVDRARLTSVDVLTPDDARRYGELVQRRCGREPLQHILGRAAFRYFELDVGPGVFVPRPETELLAGTAVDELLRLTRAGVGSPHAVDLCTGSGAVALAMATEAPGSRVTAVEISHSAYGYARRNCRASGVDLRLGDIADAVDDLAGQVHVVTANPPYIPLGAFESVDPEAREFEPATALWSGADGLDMIRSVASVAARLLVDGGLVVCEHADLQGESAPAVFAAAGGWSEVRDHVDLAGRPRFLTARRRAGRRPRPDPRRTWPHRSAEPPTTRGGLAP
jgi:release factor glutamine methyltransferase